MNEPLVIDRSDSFPHQEVLTLSGPLTAGNAPVFQNAMRREEPAETLILDFTDVPYVDSAGLGLLVTAYVSRQKSGRQSSQLAIPIWWHSKFPVLNVDTTHPFTA